MSDEGFFREVNEDLRAERLRGFWNRFGWMIITAVLVIILATAAWRGYEYWQDRQAAQAGDKFLAALTLAQSGDTEAAMAALQELEAEGFGAYSVLARMRAATLSAEADNYGEAIEAFQAIAADESVPLAVREAASIRAAYLLVDHGSYEDVLATVEDMTGDGHPMRHSAREVLGMAAWKAGDVETASGWFEEILADAQAGPGFAQRANLMLDLIAASGPEGEAPATAAPQAGADQGATTAPLDLQEIAPELAPSTAEDETDEAEAEAETPALDPTPAAPETVPLTPSETDNPS